MLKKEEKSKLDKFKNLLGIGSGGSTSAGSSRKLTGSTTSGAQQTSKQFVFTKELIEDISASSPANHRMNTIRELCTEVQTKQLENNALQVLWVSIQDLLQPDVPVESRHLVLQFLQCVVSGQYERLKIMRAAIFAMIKAHSINEDLHERLELFKLLSKDGKNLEYFEEETGAFLLVWMKDVIGSPELKQFLGLLVNVVKYNAACIEEDAIFGFVQNICCLTIQQEEIQLCLKILDTIVCYSYLPDESLGYVIEYLCKILSYETYCKEAWLLMKKLLGTHLGHSAIYVMCCILQDSKYAVDSGNLLLRGAVFFIGMALWGSQKVESLKHPPSAVLASFKQALINSSSRMVAYEVVLSIQRLVNKYGTQQQLVTWDVILDIVDKLLNLVEVDLANDTTLVDSVHDLLTAIETLHERAQFNGSKTRFFSIIERCAEKRPESSILILLTYKARFILPTENCWVQNLNYLVERYFKYEKRTQIRVKVLETLAYVLTANRQLYQDDLIDTVVLPHFAHIENEADPKVRVRAVQLLVDLIATCQSPRCTDILDVLHKVMNRLFVSSAPSSPNVLSSEPLIRTKLDYEDVKLAANGLVHTFKTKLYQQPSNDALQVFQVLVSHVEAHYAHCHLLVNAANIRKEILECFLDLRADCLHRLGLIDRNGSTSFSPYVLCRSRGDACDESSPLDVSDGGAAIDSSVHSPVASRKCAYTVIPYDRAFQCICLCLCEEVNWPVLKMAFERLLSLLENKTLLLATQPSHFRQVCKWLCLVVNNPQLGLPEKILNAPPSFSRSHLHASIFPLLDRLVSYHTMLNTHMQQDLVKSLEAGLCTPHARLCVSALTLAMIEMPDTMGRHLPIVLLKLSRVSATVAMAIPLMEFLSNLIHLNQLYVNFVVEQYMTIFAIALPYTNPFKYSHYAVSLAYHVMAMWFLKCRLPFRKGFVSFIIKGLRANVLRQFEDVGHMVRFNQDSSERSRTHSLNDDYMRSKSRAAAATAVTSRSKATSVESMHELLSTFHKELTETCIDMMSRYTFSSCASVPQRSTLAEFLLAGGRSRSWLLGNNVITVTTSGGAHDGRTGMCARCLSRARSDTAPVNIQQTPLSGSQRRRHRSAAVRARSDEVTLRPASQDDILVPRQGSTAAGLKAASPVVSHSDKMRAIDNVLMDLKVNPTDKSVFSAPHCNCWCPLWAEIYIRKPTGNLSWMLRLQNEPDLANDFPEFPLLTNLLRSDVDLADVRRSLDIGAESSTILNSDQFGEEAGEDFSSDVSCRRGTRSRDAFLKLSQESKESSMDEHIFEEDEENHQENKDTTLGDSRETRLKKCRSFPELASSPSHQLYDQPSKAQNGSEPTTQPPTPAPEEVDSAIASITKTSKLHLLVDSKSTTDVIADSHASSGDFAEQQQRRRPASMNLDDHKWTPPSSAPIAGSMDGQSGVDPSFIFLQLYHSQTFGSTSQRPIVLPNSEAVKRSIKILDLVYPYETHKIGVIYVQKGQIGDQAAILSNVYGSSRYMNFLQSLGHLIRLRDCDGKMVYMGGLDSSGSDGQFTYAWHDKFLQVIFHVATLMPTKESDPNCDAKKMHIGNDYVTVIYNDSGEEYKMGIITGQFNYVNIVIQPLDHAMNAVTVQTKDDIEDVIGHTDTKIISDANLAFLVRQMAVHANLASTIVQKQKSTPNDPYASNWLERLRQIKRLRSKVIQEQPCSDGGGGGRGGGATDWNGRNADDFTDCV